MDFSAEVISWYQQNKRDLPWRNTKDPYTIWLSEVILQQTRVEQGLPYFYRFSEKYPTVADLAGAEEGEILNLWQGLGYYSRGRNMHHTARQIMSGHDGVFPVAYDQLLQLKGIGEYTAAAVSSFAANEPKAVVDGNVFRLLSRFFGIAEPVDSGKGKKTFTDLANQLIDKDHPGLFNQAMMEFGSRQCRPRNPLCLTCPLQMACIAFTTGRISELPVKGKKQKVRARYFYYFIAVKNGKLLLNKRGPRDIWQHLYEPPLVETEAPVPVSELIHTPQFEGLFGKEVKVEQVSPVISHVLSHQKLNAVFIQISGYKELFKSNTKWFYAGAEELPGLAQPKLIFAFLKNYPDFHSDQF